MRLLRLCTAIFSLALVSSLYAQTPGSVVTISGVTTYTMHPTNRVIVVNPSAGDMTVTLAAPTIAGQEVMVILITTPTNKVTVGPGGSIVDRNGLRFMGGGATCQSGDVVHFVADGFTTWYVTDANNNNCTNHVTNLPPGAQVTVAQGTAQWQTLYWDNTSLTPGWNASNVLTNNTPANRIGVGTTTPTDLFTVGSTNPFTVSNAGKLTTSGGMTLTSLPTATATSWLVLDASNNVSKSSAAAVTGSGTTNTIPLWTGSTTLGDSRFSQTTTEIVAADDIYPSSTNSFDLGASAKRWKDGWFQGAITAGTYSGLTLQANLVGFQISGGTTSKTLTVPLDASVSGTNTGDVTLAGQNYLSLSGQQITANAVDLSGTNATGILAAARFPALTGDVTTVSGALATTIANNAVTNAKFRQSAALSVVGNATNATANVADIAGTTDQVLRVNGAGNALAFGQVATGGITDAAVTYAKIQNMATGKLHGRSTAGTGSVEELGLTNGITISGGNVGLGAITPTSVNGLTLQANLVGFQISGGTTSKTLTVPLDASVSGTNTGDVTLAGQNYLSLSGQQITANAVDLSGTNATGILAAARFPALTGDVTTVSGALATTIANNAVTNAKFRQSAALSVVGNATNATANVADIAGTTDQVLRVNGAGNAVGFGAIDISKSAAVAGLLAVGNGGTGVSTASANTVFAGPTSGGSAAPGFRALVTADLPAVTVYPVALATPSGNAVAIPITSTVVKIVGGNTAAIDITIAAGVDGQNLFIFNSDNTWDTKNAAVIGASQMAHFIYFSGIGWIRVTP